MAIAATTEATATAAPGRAWAGPALVAASLAWAYHATIAGLAARWAASPEYNHGFLVLPVAAAIAWRRRGAVARVAARPSAWGWAGLAAALAARAGAFEGGYLSAEAATFPLAVGSLCVAAWGWGRAWALLPAIAFPLLMIPLPAALNAAIVAPLQGLATFGSTALLQMTGLPAISSGNVIIVESTTLEVARACNGLSMLLSFVALVAAEVYLSGDRPAWQRAVLLAGSAPIALACNVARIAATAWAYRLLGVEAGEALAHDAAGWAMMPLGLLLGWAEIRLLSALLVERRGGRGRRGAVGLVPAIGRAQAAGLPGPMIEGR